MSSFMDGLNSFSEEFKSIKNIFSKKVAESLELVRKEDFDVYAELVDKMIQKAEEIEGKLNK